MDAVFEQIIKFISSAEGASLTIAMVIEFIFRMIPSQKPLSIMYVVAAVARKSGEILVKIGNLLDKILPQKLK